MRTTVRFSVNGEMQSLPATVGSIEAGSDPVRPDSYGLLVHLDLAGLDLAQTRALLPHNTAIEVRLHRAIWRNAGSGSENSMQTPHEDYAFSKHLNAWLRELGQAARRGSAKWTPALLFNYAALGSVIATLAVMTPNRFFNPDLRHITLALGILGTWRFGWWFTHACRAEYFRRLKWPPIRRAASAHWASIWHPRRVHIQMTTCYEQPAITRAGIGSILQQIRRERIPVSLWIGTGSAHDEMIIREYVETHGADIPVGLAELIVVRQNQPGKRMAIGLILRGMDPDDLVIFMDGDAVYGHDVMEKTLSMFGADPELQALTTDEEVMCYGPRWIGAWLEMRFAQRRLAMQSHAVSSRVLTLTGRMSVFRARYIVDEKFIRTIEADHLDHWLCGLFRFLSGDDKSTWYHLLSKGAKMIYAPMLRST